MNVCSKFEFTEQNLKKAHDLISHYPKDNAASAVVGLLDIAQRQNGGWLSKDIIAYIADFLSIPYIRAYEVASFYTMFNLEEVGKYHVQVCTTTPCWLRGSDKIMQSCVKVLGIGNKQTTEDCKFTLSEVECLGACVNAPVVQINDNYYEDLSEENIEQILTDLKNDKNPKYGTQSHRKSSEPLK